MAGTHTFTYPLTDDRIGRCIHCSCVLLPTGKYKESLAATEELDESQVRRCPAAPPAVAERTGPSPDHLLWSSPEGLRACPYDREYLRDPSTRVEGNYCMKCGWEVAKHSAAPPVTSHSGNVRFDRALTSHKVGKSGCSSSRVSESAWAREMRLLPCFGCGYDGTQRTAEWPKPESPGVTVAHLIREKFLESLDGSRSRERNFIPLCGTHGMVGTCHHLFDSYLLAFIWVGKHNRWLRLVHPDYSFLRGETVYPGKVKPSRTLLHAHAEASLDFYEQITFLGSPSPPLKGVAYPEDVADGEGRSRVESWLRDVTPPVCTSSDVIQSDGSPRSQV